MIANRFVKGDPRAATTVCPDQRSVDIAIGRRSNAAAINKANGHPGYIPCGCDLQASADTALNNAVVYPHNLGKVTGIQSNSGAGATCPNAGSLTNCTPLPRGQGCQFSV